MRRSGKVWVSNLVWKVWELLYRIWDYWNRVLHIVNRSLYKDERIAMDQAIRSEFFIRLNSIPASIEAFFKGNIN